MFHPPAPACIKRILVKLPEGCLPMVPSKPWSLVCWRVSSLMLFYIYHVGLETSEWSKSTEYDKDAMQTHQLDTSLIIGQASHICCSPRSYHAAAKNHIHFSSHLRSQNPVSRSLKTCPVSMMHGKKILSIRQMSWVQQVHLSLKCKSHRYTAQVCKLVTLT